MTLGERLSIKERALAAWREREAEAAYVCEQRTLRERGVALERLRDRVDAILGDEAVVLTDVTLHQDAEEDWFAEGLVDGTPVVCGIYGLVMRFPCTACGLTTVRSPDFTDMSSLGRFLADRETNERYTRQCPDCFRAQNVAARAAPAVEADQPADANTLPPRCVEARLGDLLRELIDARLAVRAGEA